jgi:hypothetical protein
MTARRFPPPWRADYRAATSCCLERVSVRIEFPCPTHLSSIGLVVGTTAGREVGHQSPPCPRFPVDRKSAAATPDMRRPLRWRLVPVPGRLDN